MIQRNGSYSYTYLIYSDESKLQIKHLKVDCITQLSFFSILSFMTNVADNRTPRVRLPRD